MADFNGAIAVVLKHEVAPDGQAYACHELDPGGPTKFGVTQATYSAYLKRTASVEDVQTMPLDAAKSIYQASYWGVIQGDKIKSEALATNFMDMAVLRGVVAAIKTMQGCVGAVQDGLMGPKTLAAIDSQNPAVLIVSYYLASLKALTALVSAQPQRVVFLNNWTSRVSDMLQPISAMLRQPQPAPKSNA